MKKKKEKFITMLEKRLDLNKNNLKHLIKIGQGNDDEIKIYKKGKTKPNNFYQNNLTYYTSDSIKLLPKDGILKSLERQKYIKLTYLTVGIVYLKNRFAGCILIRQFGIQIHKLTGLPLILRKKIYLKDLKA